jgi:1,4-alpha-glucan branching enzyme
MPAPNHKGHLCLLLHAHLPYVRHPEHEFFLEENWLYEAITETYVPLIDVFSRLTDDRIDFRITLSLSPTLLAMFQDDLLMERYRRHLERLLELTGSELSRTKRDIHFGPVVRMYHKRFLSTRHLFDEIYKGNLIAVLRQLQDSGNVEIITSAATHAFLPNLSLYPQSVKAQIEIGSWYYRKLFDRPPRGIWLPECGFMPGFDGFVKEAGSDYLFLDTHGIIHGSPPPQYGVYAPIMCPSGVAAFGRDGQTSKQVWSSIEGYPGDGAYRDFYRDIGFDLGEEHTGMFLQPYGTKTYTGLKYYRITGKTDYKRPYVIRQAKEKALEHAKDFIMKRERQVDILSEKFSTSPVITAMYDAELFGHWWFEGPEWLEYLLRGIHSGKRNFTTTTPGEYLSSQTSLPGGIQTCEPSMSSWGEKGYNEVWLNASNDYVYRHLFKAAERMTDLADQFSDAGGLLLRALNQAAREVLLSQHSDWTFMIKNNTATEYAKRRIAEHIGRFTFLYEAIISGNIPEERLAEIEDRDRIFRDIDYRVFSSRQRMPGRKL